MAMTITEKILAEHCGAEEVCPGQLINAKLDIVLGNDITAPIAIDELKKTGVKRVFDRHRVVLIPDHFTPNKDIPSAEQCKILREFAKEQELTHYYEVGEAGIEHALLPEKGIVLPGDLVIGADSHTCTYGALGAFSTGVGSTDLAAAMITGDLWFKVPDSMKIVLKGELRPPVSAKDLILTIIGDIGASGANYLSVEFHGNVAALDFESRMTVSNMGAEMGAKDAVFPVDRITRQYLESIGAVGKWEAVWADEDAEYTRGLAYDLGEIEPVVARPHQVDNVAPARELHDIAINQFLIGTCTNGRLGDLRVAADILRGKHVHPDARLLVLPASRDILLEAINDGTIPMLIDSGATVLPPGCGPCLGAHQGVLAPGERCLSTANRNFKGRMGCKDAEIYLASPATVAASALEGRIVDPTDFI